jgi:hypothetical protein
LVDSWADGSSLEAGLAFDPILLDQTVQDIAGRRSGQYVGQSVEPTVSGVEFVARPAGHVVPNWSLCAWSLGGESNS